MIRRMIIVDAVERIEKDIVLFTKNIKEIESIKIDEEERQGC